MILAIAAFVLFLAIHLVWWRGPFQKLKGVSGLFLWGFISAVVVIITSWIEFEIPLEATLFTVGTAQAFLVMLYSHWYVGVDRSVSVRILNELARSGGQITATQLAEVYPMESMFSHRVETLVETGWIEQKNKLLVCRPRALRLVHWTQLLRKIYNLKITG